MQRFVTAALAVMVIAAGAFAYPGVYGSRGLFRVQDARTEGDYQISFTAHGLSRSARFSEFDPESWRAGYTPEMNAYTNDLIGAVAVSPLEYFELFFWTGELREYTSQHPDSSARSMAWLRGYQNMGDWHNRVVGAKVSLPLLPVFKVGASVGYSFFEYDPTGWRWGVFGIPPMEGLVWTALGTFYLRDVADWTPTVHVNYGMAGEDWSSLGAALEYEIGKLDLFAEFVSEGDPDNGFFSDQNPMYVTPGVKVGYLRPLTLEGGVSIGMNDATPDMEAVVGLSLTSTFWKPRAPSFGTVAGVVVDAESKQPLAATVSFPETDVADMMTDVKTGTFKAKKLEPGTVVIEVNADGYRPAVVSVQVVAGEVTQQEFALAAVVTSGAIAGMVMDASTERGLAGAKVRFPGGEFAPLTADEDGMFALEEVEQGGYVLEASSEGYLTATMTVEVKPGEEAEAKFALVKKGMEITLKVFFDVDKSTLKPESKKVLEQAGKIMKENPGITVEIQGHTDNTGTAAHNQKLSQERAMAVVDYLVKELGVDGKRLKGKGYGEDKPAATNDTEEGRAQNRRVEFVVNK